MIEWLIIGVAVNRERLNLNLFLFNGMNNPNLLKYNKILFQARIWMILIVDYGGPDVKVVESEFLLSPLSLLNFIIMLLLRTLVPQVGHSVFLDNGCNKSEIIM